MSPHNRYRAAPPPPPVGGAASPSLVQTLGPLALKYGVNAAIPGGGFGADAAMALGSQFFDVGGEVRDRWGSGASFRQSATPGVYDVYRDGEIIGQQAGTREQAPHAGPQRGITFAEAMAMAAAKKKAAEKIEDTPAKEVKSAVAKAAAEPYYNPNTRFGVDINEIPLGQLLGADITGSASYQDKISGQDPWSAGLKASWKFEEGGNVREKGTNRGGATADAIRKGLDWIWGKGRAGESAAKNMDKYRPKAGSPHYKALGGPMTGQYNPAQDPARKIGDSIAARGGAMMFEEGGSVKCGPLAGMTYKHTTKDGVSHHVERKYHDPNKAKPTDK